MGKDVSVSVIRRTTYETERPSHQAALNGKESIVALSDEKYDFSRQDHRQEIMGKMAHDLFVACGYDGKGLGILVEEMEGVVRSLQKELPFE